MGRPRLSAKLIDSLRLGWGKLRRGYIQTFNPGYIQRNLARRRGDCRRCGSCCRLLFSCPYLERNGGDCTSCLRHSSRAHNCRVFPIDERDIADRDRISDNGPCGYTFDSSSGAGKKPPGRWLVTLALAAGLGALAGLVTSEDALAARGAHRDVGGKPVTLRSGFGVGKLPSGWRIGSGRWEPRRGGLFTADGGSLVGLLREDGLPVVDAEFRIEVWASFAGNDASPGDGARGTASTPASAPTPTASSPALAAAWGEITAGLREPDSGSAFVSFGRQADVVKQPSAVHVRETGRLRLLAFTETDRRLVTVRAGRAAEVRGRDVFGRAAGAPPREITIGACAGVTVYAVRVLGRSRPGGRAESAPRSSLAGGDASYREGDLPAAEAAYADAMLVGGHEDATRAERAEAAYKYGVVVRDTGNGAAAALAFGRAQELDPEGPWGERARLALAEAALESDRPGLALAFALRTAEGATSGIEEWRAFRSVMSRAREELVSGGSGPSATFTLRRIAERIEWTSTSRGARPGRGRAAWAWGEVANALAGRGLTDDAEALRERLSVSAR